MAAEVEGIMEPAEYPFLVDQEELLVLPLMYLELPDQLLAVEAGQKQGPELEIQALGEAVEQ